MRTKAQVVDYKKDNTGIFEVEDVLLFPLEGLASILPHTPTISEYRSTFGETITFLHL